jgi:phage recombination protein Bet
MTTALATLTGKLAARLDMGDSTGLMETLKATAFKGPVTDAQMTALMIVANNYGLNPWTKEIYAFPDKNNGIVPVVGVDGWSRIINSHPQFDGIDFEQDAESCTCTIHRKDRGHPIRVTEYMIECRRDVGPWKSHPYRMLRHKALIQCARLAFGFVGIFDHDEAERIVEAEAKEVPRHSPTKNAPDVVTGMTPKREAEIRAACDMAAQLFDGGNGDEVAAYEQVSGLDDSDEVLFAWNYMKPNSKLRSAIKRLQAADREADAKAREAQAQADGVMDVEAREPA